MVYQSWCKTKKSRLACDTGTGLTRAAMSISSDYLETCSTTFVKAAGSCTAKSANTLRFNRTSDFRNAPSKREYVVPFRRAAALILAIHSRRNWRLRWRRSRYEYCSDFSTAFLATVYTLLLRPQNPLAKFRIRFLLFLEATLFFARGITLLFYDGPY